MVNRDFLAFLSLEEHEYPQIKHSQAQNQGTAAKGKRLALWQFLRHASASLISAQSATSKRHQVDRQEILKAIHHGAVYPWALLLRLKAKKLYSDLFEAILGAIWVDSGSMAQCEAFLARLGMMPYLVRILRDSVHVQHPKEELTKLSFAEKVIYNVERVPTQDDGADLRCTILIGNRQVAEVDGGLTPEEIETKAATAAVALLRH